MAKRQLTDIYGYFDYVSYLKSALPAKGEGRGARTRLAKTLNCQPGFISLVLTEKAALSLEHGIQVAQFLALNDDEKDYLLLLIQKDRAGSTSLRNHFSQQLKKIQAAKREVQSRIETTHALSEFEQQQYYEDWFLTAIHMCTLVPSLCSTRAMADYLHISHESAREGVDKLKQMGLVTQDGLKFRSTQKRLHLGKKNLALKSHHTNWRLKAIESLRQQRDGELHYTSVMSISHLSANQIQQILLKAVQDSEPLIKEAQDEAVYTLVMDFFEVNKS